MNSPKNGEASLVLSLQHATTTGVSSISHSDSLSQLNLRRVFYGGVIYNVMSSCNARFQTRQLIIVDSSTLLHAHDIIQINTNQSMYSHLSFIQHVIL